MAHNSDLVGLATDLTITWLANSNTRAAADDVPAFLATMHQALSGLVGPAGAEEPEEPTSQHTPAVSLRKSLGSREHIISMIDGKPYKSLTRHLRTHGLTPADYRQRFGLKPDYPMVAPAYSGARRDFALKNNLGQKGRAARAQAAAAARSQEQVATPAKTRVRKGVSAANKATKAHHGTADA